jgi:hypothetical protein
MKDDAIVCAVLGDNQVWGVIIKKILNIAEEAGPVLLDCSSLSSNNAEI